MESLFGEKRTYSFPKFSIISNNFVFSVTEIVSYFYTKYSLRDFFVYYKNFSLRSFFHVKSWPDVIKLVLHSKKLENFKLCKTRFIDFLIPLVYLYWKWLVIITSKFKRIFPKKNCMFFYLPPFQSTRNDIIKLILYSKGWYNYKLCKKSRHFYYPAYFFIRNTW